MAQQTSERFVDVGKIKPSKDNPRGEVTAADLEELAQSIKSQGILQPLLVVAEGDGYTIVAGERRFRAAKIAGLKEVPVVVREFDEQTRLEVMLVENLQREDLTPIEEGRTFLRLTEEPFNLSQRDLAPRVGKSQSHISKRIALLKLPDAAQADVEKGKLPVQDAEQLARLEPEDMADVYKAAKADPYQDVRQHVDRRVAGRKRQEKIDKAFAEVEAAGLTVYEGDDDWSYSSKSEARTIGPDTIHGLTDVDPKAHEKLDCHRVGIDANGKKVPLCIEPKNHTKGKAATGDNGKAETAKPKPTAEEKASDRWKAHDKAMREARGERAEFMQTQLGRRTPKAQTFSYLLETLIDSANSNQTKLAVGLLGLDEETLEKKEPREALRDYAAETEDTLSRAALAVGFAMNEEQVRGAWTPWVTVPAIGRHFAFLETLGYGVSPAEDKTLQGKEPKKPGA